MARSKKVMKEIAIDSGSDASDVEEPAPKPVKQAKVAEIVAEEPAVKKVLSDKKMDALRLA